MIEDISNLDHVMADFERAGATVAGLKLSWCKPGVKIVGFVCTEEGRIPDMQMVMTLVRWPAYGNVMEVRAFLGPPCTIRYEYASFQSRQHLSSTWRARTCNSYGD